MKSASPRHKMPSPNATVIRIWGSPSYQRPEAVPSSQTSQNPNAMHTTPSSRFTFTAARKDSEKSPHVRIFHPHSHTTASNDFVCLPPNPPNRASTGQPAPTILQAHDPLLAARSRDAAMLPEALYDLALLTASSYDSRAAERLSLSLSNSPCKPSMSAWQSACALAT